MSMDGVDVFGTVADNQPSISAPPSAPPDITSNATSPPFAVGSTADLENRAAQAPQQLGQQLQQTQQPTQPGQYTAGNPFATFVQDYTIRAQNSAPRLNSGGNRVKAMLQNFFAGAGDSMLVSAGLPSHSMQHQQDLANVERMGQLADQWEQVQGGIEYRKALLGQMEQSQAFQGQEHPLQLEHMRLQNMAEQQALQQSQTNVHPSLTAEDLQAMGVSSNVASQFAGKPLSGADMTALKEISQGASKKPFDYGSDGTGASKGIWLVDANFNPIKQLSTVSQTGRATTRAQLNAQTREPEIEIAAQALVDPQNLTALKDIASLRGDQRLKIFARAKKIDPNFDPGVTNQRVHFLQSYEDPKGRAATNRQAINNILQHAGDLSDLNQQYRRADVRVINTPLNAIANQFGNEAYTRFSTTNSVLKDELSLYFAGGYAPTADQQKIWNKIQSDTATPAQTENFAKEVVHLGLRRANTFNSQFRTNMGYDDPNMITPEAKNAAERLGLGNEVSQFGSGGGIGRGAPSGQLNTGGSSGRRVIDLTQ